MKYLKQCAVPTIAVLLLVATSAAHSHSFKSLQHYCVQSGAASKADCQCGSDTAMKITTTKERRVILDMMAGDQQTRQGIMRSMNPEQLKLIMNKMAKITSGCDKK